MSENGGVVLLVGLQGGASPLGSGNGVMSLSVSRKEAGSVPVGGERGGLLLA